MGSPVRCLDELWVFEIYIGALLTYLSDVFMDVANREVSIDLIVRL